MLLSVELKHCRVCTDPKAIRKSDDVAMEMNRLKKNLIPTLPTLQCASLTGSHVTIALLNVHSITSKLTDLQSEEMLEYASVLCFCETWLKPSDPSPVLLDNHIVLRSDRQHHNNKGGVLMSVLQLPKPGFILRNSN